MKKIYYFALIFVIFSLSNCSNPSQQAAPPAARDGVLDLRNWDFKRQGPVQLKGDWKFKWMEDNPQFIFPDYNDRDWDVFPVPGKWNRKIDAQTGFGWLRLEIKLNTARELGLYLWSSETAGIIYANSTESIKVGKPGTNRETTIVRQVPVVEQLPSADRLVLAWKVANFHDHSGGGPVYAPHIGIFKELKQKLWDTDFFNILILGIILIMGIYHMMLWLWRRDDKSSLLFAFFCLNIFLRALATNNVLQRLLPDVDLFSIKLKIEYISTSLGWALFVSFLSKVFPKEYPKIIVRIFQISGIVISLFILVTPVWVFTEILLVNLIVLVIVCIWIIISIIIAVKNKRGEAGIVLVGFILLFITVFNDVIHAQYVLPTGYIAQIGLVLFIFCFSAVLSLRFAKAYKTADHLSKNLQKEVAEQTKIITEKNRKLSRLNQEKTDYFINLAHETKTPLTLIHNYLKNYIQKRGMDPDLSIIQNNIEKLKKNMVNFLDYEKLEKGQAFYNHEEITDLSEILEESVSLFKETAALKQIAINANIEKNIQIKADPYAICRVINNLIDNAIRYTEKQGSIDIELHPHNERVELTIKDTGIGIEKEQLANIFKTYYQISHKKQNIQGIGMGLSIVKKILDDIGAHITVLSEPGEGSEFRISFKEITEQSFEKKEKAIKLKEYPEYPVISEHVKELAPGIEDTHKKTILIVEDNTDMISYLYDALNAEYNVYCAGNGKQALAELESIQDLHLVVSDIMMDVMDGYEFYEKFKKDVRYSHIPVIFLTAKNTQFEKIQALQKGAVDFMCKPFDIEELKAKIHSFIKISESQYEKSKHELIKHVMEVSKSGMSEERFFNEFDDRCRQYDISFREKEIMLLLLKGKQYKEISNKLSVSLNTVKSHISKIYKKFGVKKKSELMSMFHIT